MKIVILDGYTSNPGDLSWEGLKALGDLTVYDRTAPEQTLERAAGAEILLTNKVALGEGELATLPQLKYIGVQATGVNVVDLNAARKHGVAVTNVPAYSTASVAQHVFALILELARGVGQHAAAVKDGAWSNCPDFTFQQTPQLELCGKTIGIVGFGDIGQATAQIAAAFGMQVVVHTRTPVPESFPRVTFSSLEKLLADSDIVSLSCPLTPQTEGMINAERLAMMKSTAFLINTGRGQLVDEYALAAALYNEEIAAAGLDVLSQEPPQADNFLLKVPNCIITPHIAWATHAARQRLVNEVVANLKAFLNGEKLNRVD
jgi:glycerate dehydrogenase